MRGNLFPWVIGFLVVLLGWQFWPNILRFAASDFVKARESGGVYFRLLAKYQHGNEIIEFNVVAGCAVNVTRYGDGSSSYDAFLDPVIYARATKDGGAIWQIMPSACLRETTANGKVPMDFLPGAIWFDDAQDFSFGTAYVTEDAFENRKSKLKFLGASIHAATRDEWEAFRPVAKENLVNPAQFGSDVYHPTPQEIATNLWNKKVLVAWRPTSKCYLVERYQISDPLAIAAIRELRPDSQPRFWTIPQDQMRDLESRIFQRGRIEVRGVPNTDYFHFGHYQAVAFPTRARGGMLRSDGSSSSKLPAEIYPIKMGDGIPWLTPELADADTIYAEVDLDQKSNRGFSYCYSTLRSPGDIRDAHLPAYHERNFATRVDGLPIFWEEQADPHVVDGPRMFFEDDNAYYLRSDFGF